MKKFFALLLTVSLCLMTFPQLFATGHTQTTQDKFLRSDNPIAGQYIVVLQGTDLSPVVDPTPDASPSPPPELVPDPTPSSSPTAFSASLTPSSDSVTTTFSLDTSAPPPATSSTPAPSATSSPAPDPSSSPDPTPTPDPDVAAKADYLTSTYGGTYSDTWATAVKGFVLNASESTAIAMSEDPSVAFIEEDGQVTANPTQYYPPWGLDRIDQRYLPLSRTYTYRNTGAGVNAYVIDTGITPSHVEYRGRAFVIYDAFGSNGIDCNGHGTHVAGTIGGRTYGVAKGVRLFGVRVLDCGGGGSWSSVINGVNFVTWHHLLPWYRYSPAVANMSLGGPANYSVDWAVRNSIRWGVTYCVAAGNSNMDARYFSPARVAEAITVGATDWFDNRAWFSNWGPALHLFAPGVNITSAWIGSNYATNTISGTSMATPHVTGVAALYLQSYPRASPGWVNWVLTGIATYGVVRNPGPSPNRLLFTAF